MQQTQPLDRVHLTVTGAHILQNLSLSLYGSVGQQLMELVRNSASAAMRDNNWEPERARVRILLEEHPLADEDGRVLIIVDNGCGLDEVRLQRFFMDLGKVKTRKGGSHALASQKGIGRFAGWALNAKCHQEDLDEAAKHGYYVLSRTVASGNVRFIPVLPEMQDIDKGFVLNTFIPPFDKRMGSLKGITGSFTAIVIPSPVFKTAEEIEEAIKWLLPRDRQKMFHLMINKKEIIPPALETDVTQTYAEDTRFFACLGKAEENGEGPWFADAETGFRVARCQSLVTRLPDPIASSELTGDIFVPGLLQQQNTARDGLATDFTSKTNPTWAALYKFLRRDVAPRAKDLVNRGTIKSGASKSLVSVLKLFTDKYGEVGHVPGEEGTVHVEPRCPTPPRTNPSPNPTPRQPDEKKEPVTTRIKTTSSMFRIKIRNDVYYFKQDVSLPPFVFAQIDRNNPNVIWVNVREGAYKAMPTREPERMEHITMQIRNAVALKHMRNQPERVQSFANELRSELMS